MVDAATPGLPPPSPQLIARKPDRQAPVQPNPPAVYVQSPTARHELTPADPETSEPMAVAQDGQTP